MIGSEPEAKSESERVPVRVAFALSGGGSLGTFVSAAVREVLLAIEVHNLALREGGHRDRRLLHPRWGHISVDAIGGSSAGALCGTQIVRALFDRAYLGEGLPLDALATLTGDWVSGGSFQHYVPEDARPMRSGPVASPGWTVLSGTRLFQRTRNILSGRLPGRPGAAVPMSCLDASGLVGLAVTLTDTIGFHEPAEFEPDRVLGHPSFGRSDAMKPRYFRGHFEEVRDLGVRNHAETRRLFIARDEETADVATRALRSTRRARRARALAWGRDTAETLAGLAAASASLPFAFGPLALRDQAVELEEACTRLYMDGGTLNNRPIAPALNLGRWGDGVRLMSHRGEDGSFSRDAVAAELSYERVVFFVDAFPDPTGDPWLSPHPDVDDPEDAPASMDRRAQAARASRIRAVLDAPGAGLDLFMESVLSSLRAQDIRDIAKSNFRLRQRRRFIEERCKQPPPPRPDFRIDSLSRAAALSAVLDVPCGRGLPHAVALAVAERVWESDQLSGLSGRREVTMVPLFSPRNHEGALAGEALYTLGGLLSLDSRRHDARIGSLVAQRVLEGVADPERELTEVHVQDAHDEVLPEDASPLVDRLRVVTRETLGRMGGDSRMARWLSSMPALSEPLFRRLQTRLDEVVRGVPALQEGHEAVSLPGEEEESGEG